MALNLEERGAYTTVLDLIYSKADELVDDDRFIAGWCGCDVRVWRRIKARLIALGKLHIDNGMLRNFRATSGVEEGLSRIGSARNAANIRHDMSSGHRNKNNDLDAAPAMRSVMPITTTTTPTIEPPADAGGVAREARPPPKPRVVKFAIPIGWQPAPETAATLTAKGYSDHEIAWQRDRFLAHFLDSGERRPGWERSFHNWVTRDPPGKRNGGAPSHAGRYPSGGRQTDGSITGALAFLARQRAENGDDS